MPGHVRVRGPGCGGLAEEPGHGGPFPAGQVVQVRGQADDPAQRGPGRQDRAGRDQLPGPGHRGDTEPDRDQGMRPGRDPHRVRAGDLAPVHPAQFTQLDVTLGETSRATGAG